MKNNENEIKKINVENENDIPATEMPEVPETPETKVTVTVKKNPVEKFVENCYVKRVQKAEKQAKKAKKAAEAEQPKEKGKFSEKLRKAAVPAAIGVTALATVGVKMLLRGGASTGVTQTGEESSVETADIPVTETTDPAVSE